MRLAIILAASLLAAPAAAQDYVLQLEYESDTQGDEDGSTSSASGRQAMAERVISVTPEGTEVEYSLPFDPEEIRGNERWMFPARMRIAPDGAKTILNEPELLARNAAWLAEAKWTRDMCSRWGFSWTTYQVRCDPEAAIEAVDMHGMQPGRIAEGQPFTLEGALGPVVLTRAGENEGRVVLRGSGPVDPAYVREKDARAALVMAEITRKALSLEEAKAKAAGITASGTLTVTFEIDAAGMVWRREDRSDITLAGASLSNGTTRTRQTVTRLPRAEWDRQQAEQAAEAEAADPMADPNPEAEAAELQ